VSSAVKKANKTLKTINLKRKKFNASELTQLLTSNFYSSLYCYCKIWLLTSLKQILKHSLLAASKMPLNASTLPKHFIGFQKLYVMINQVTPDMTNN
jgi:hypothetical protein